MDFKRSVCLAVTIILLGFGATPSTADDARPGPFFMFANGRFADRAQDEAIRAVLREYLDERDYLGVDLRRRDAELARRIAREHTFALPASVTSLEKRAEGGEAKLLIYDIEHWSATPQDEQKGPADAVKRAITATKRHNGCRFGMSPDGPVLGIDLKTRKASLDNSLLRSVDLGQVDLIGLQVQRLLSDEWVAGGGGAEPYVAFVSELAKYAKGRNPKILVVAQLSFRYTPAKRAIEAMRRVQGEVDGFYLAFPAVTPNVPCHYCDADNLRQVLAVRTPVGKAKSAPPAK